MKGIVYRRKEWHLEDNLESVDRGWSLIRVFDTKKLTMDMAKLWISTHPNANVRILEVTTTKKEIEIK